MKHGGIDSSSVRSRSNWVDIVHPIGVGICSGILVGVAAGPGIMEAVPHELMVDYFRSEAALAVHAVIDQIVQAMEQGVTTTELVNKAKVGMVLGAMQGMVVGGMFSVGSAIARRIHQLIDQLPTTPED